MNMMQHLDRLRELCIRAGYAVSREVLAGYDRVEFFPAGEPAVLAQLMADGFASGKFA